MSACTEWRRQGGHLLEHGEREPQQEDELEKVVEREPVDDADEALDDAVALLACDEAAQGMDAALT